MLLLPITIHLAPFLNLILKKLQPHVPIVIQQTDCETKDTLRIRTDIYSQKEKSTCSQFKIGADASSRFDVDKTLGPAAENKWSIRNNQDIQNGKHSSDHGFKRFRSAPDAAKPPPTGARTERSLGRRSYSTPDAVLPSNQLPGGRHLVAKVSQEILPGGTKPTRCTKEEIERKRIEAIKKREIERKRNEAIKRRELNSQKSSGTR